MSLIKQRKLQTRRKRLSLRTRRRDRQGVIMMVVLSLLALFLVLGTAFIVSSRSYESAGKASAKLNRTENNPADLLERAMLQVLRDTNNPFSAIRGHSLLRDQYGTDGFIANVFADQSSGSSPYTARYAGTAVGTNNFGPTNGQIIELYVADPDGSAQVNPPSNFVIRLERAPNGNTIEFRLPAASKYYNGCLLTILTGPAAGQTTRIVDYQLVDANVPIYRLRVLAFARSDGSPISPNEVQNTLGGYAFMVNGRPFNDTGAGYNRLAQTGTPRLSAVEVMSVDGGFVGSEVALTPNSQFIDLNQVAHFLGNGSGSPFSNALPPDSFQPLNASPASQLYSTVDGPGGSDESYDAVDYLNVFLAHMPVSPVAKARAVDSSGNVSELLNPQDALRVFASAGQSERWDHENTIVPSFHRPALMNYWYNRMANSGWLIDALGDPDEATLAVADPYGFLGYGNGRPGDEVYDQVVAIKRKISLRPIIEDHPSFNGTNPASLNPFWELTGPWDVDNDNDGIADSIWVDLGDPVQETENGTLYKPLYAIMVIDLDSRLNLNAHGSADHFVTTDFDPYRNAPDPTGGFVGNLIGKNTSSNAMPVGMGWGPGDVSLRSILSANDYRRLLYGRDVSDITSDAVWGRLGSTSLTGVMAPGKTFDGSTPATIAATRDPRLYFDFLGYPAVDRQRAQNLYNTTGNNGLLPFLAPSEYATSPDLRCRYATGVDYIGQPIYEPVWDGGGNLLGQPLATMVDDSPYEANTTADSRRGVPAGAGGNDDALFAPSEMERILRSYDSETGMAPSRLYDIVDAFNPVKYVQANSVDLVLAQVVTAINSKQVTTDSYEVPVPADVVPSYISELGPDGAPGRRGVDDDQLDSDQNGQAIDDAVLFNPNTGQGEIGWCAPDPNNPMFMAAWSDDFAAYTGKSVTDARLVDVLWYRIQRNREKSGLPIYNWSNPLGQAALDNISQQLLPPEVLAGYKMDINRPFGDGRDNNGNGVVDEPIEAGEPYYDSNGNTFWDAGEPFIDLDGDLTYDPPTDNLWADQLGVPIPVDNVMSLDVSGRGSFVDANNNGKRDFGEQLVNVTQLHDDAHLARQLYARHLYIMMLILTDEDYMAPYDPYDPSVRRYIRGKAQQLINSGMADLPAKIEARRRYTCRQVAQWAVNCVDFRDSDACNTPFEYDENPWDGWGTTADVANTPQNTADDLHFPLDGSVATDENYGQVVDWPNMSNDGTKVYNEPVNFESNRVQEIAATRNLVWGAERPELLISETAAFHDLRQEDRETNEDEGDNTTQIDDAPDKPQDDDLDQRLEPRGSLYVELYNPWSGDAPKPIELYRYGFTQHPNENANDFVNMFDRTGDGNVDANDTFHWADLDGDGTPETRFEGVLLNRLSNVADRNGRRSPVWRLIVVEEQPGYHDFTNQIPNQVTRDNNRSHQGSVFRQDYLKVLQIADAVRDEIPFIGPTNMDWDEMFYRIINSSGNSYRWPMSQWQQELTSNRNVNADNPKNEQASFDRQLFAKPYPYIQQEIYFNSGGTTFRNYIRELRNGNTQEIFQASQRTYHDLDTTQLRRWYSELGVRIPFNFINLGSYRFSGGVPKNLASLAFRFVSTDPTVPGRDRPDVGIAPVMPGRYAMIGSAGTSYTREQRDVDDKLRFITTVGRNVARGTTVPKAFTDDSIHLQQIETTRRIELRPSTNPLTQQFVVGANGGLFRDSPALLRRHNELISLDGNSTANMTGTIKNNELDAESVIVAPVVAVPVDDMNVSEPAYGYGVRARELSELEADSGDSQKWDPLAANGEGAFVTSGNQAQGNNGIDAHFDTPFDVDPEFQRGANRPETFSKYRVVHLQRLADPTMPWNPTPPGLNPHDRVKAPYMTHDPGLPVNPYLTVDSSAVDLTVFNGTSSVNIANPQPQNNLYRSTERGYYTYRSFGTAFQLPQRNIWAQDSFLATKRVLPSESLPSTNRLGMPQDMRQKHGVRENHYDYMLHHSLGVMNESFGDMYLRPESLPNSPATDPTDLQGDDGIEATMGPALGAPRPVVDNTGRPGAQPQGLASTYPWLNWNNRPFVSESELLQVPAWSSAEMLRKFSTLNPDLQTDPYINEGAIDAGGNLIPMAAITADLADGSQSVTVDAEATNLARYRVHTAMFGSLQNMLQSSRFRARSELTDSNGDPVPVGAPNFHRLLDYVHTPSRFIATDTLLDPLAFSLSGDGSNANIPPVTSASDPRAGMLAPFNRVPSYREPAKINLNTVVGQRAGSQTWSDVFDGLMHRLRDVDPILANPTGTFGHFGPAWQDVVMSRRGFAEPLGFRGVDLVMDKSVPTFFTNPFRSGEAGDLVPLQRLVQEFSVEASMLRSHPFQPGDGLAWGNTNQDENGNNLFDDAREAGRSNGDSNPYPPRITPNSGRFTTVASVPLFSELCSTAAIDATRNSAMHTMPLTRLDNMTTTRSGVFAVWVTVGYFEVLPAPTWGDVRQKFTNQAGGDADRGRALYSRVYPQGYQFGKELGSDTGDVERHRGFYIIDRTRPSAFKPGEDVNVENTILLRRRIE